MKMDSVRTITVAGAGTMGALIAQTFAAYGYEVFLWNRSQSGLDRGKEIMADNLASVSPDRQNAAQ